MSSIVLTQYTDPNCTWSWGAEPILRRVETLYGDQLTIDFVLGGLIEDFDEFYDAANDISVPDDVAPHWEDASRRHGMPVDAGLWEADPPLSTYPASIATKAAALQDRRLGLRYLRRLREVAATERTNIARREALLRVAETVGADVDSFAAALDDGRAERAFHADLRATREQGVRGFPTFRLRVGDEVATLGGYQSFDSLESALLEYAPGLEPRPVPSVVEFVGTYGYVATRTVAEVYGWDEGKAEQVLRAHASDGDLVPVPRVNGTFWEPADDQNATRRGTGELAASGDLDWMG